MNALSYIIQSNLLLLACGLLYYIFLRNRVRFSIARIWTVSSLIIPVMAPLAAMLIPASAAVPVAGITLQPVIVAPDSQSVAASGVDYILILKLVFAAVSLAALTRFCVGIARVLRLSHTLPHIRAGQFSYFSLPENAQAFSFYKMLFIPQNQMFSVISLHEEQHSRMNHSTDLVLSGAVSALFWINPLYWLLSKELRNIHEFQADRAVLEKGADMVQYQQTLLAAAVGHFPGLPVSQLRPSFIKTRIIMMKQNKSFSKSALWLMPAVLFVSAALWLTACGSKNSDEKNTKDSTEVTTSDDQQQKVDSTDLVYEVTEVMPEYPGGNEAMSAFMVKNIKYPPTAKENGVEGTVYISFVVSKSGKVQDVEVQKSASPELDAEAVRVVKLMPDWTPAVNQGKNVAVHMTLPVKFKLQ
ncbi:hypothetical protein SDC9_62946 [bioreactor metagenome]|uniref:TonB C-terminal domain-containing protein n=1 Tax=bioreactor metagenome TaxID=1076179 RepID=A0A644XK57_9ZZZZ